MDAQPTSLLTRMFDDIDEQVDDPRADNARHFLCDILILAFLGVMSGCDDYPGIVEFARDRKAWLKTLLPLPHGIPSVSTFRRVFAAIKPAVLIGLLQRWSGELAGTLAGKQVVLDGKAVRRSFDHAWKENSHLHLVTAWCVEENLVLAQQAVAEKKNEITAIPEVLKMLDLKGATVTIDAMGTQTAIAEQIVKAGGDYVLAVKDNHPTLADSIRRHLEEMILTKFDGVEHVYHETTDAGHGRIDTRRVWATSELDWLKRRGEWKKLSSVTVVESIRRENAKAQPSVSRRYYISSIKAESGQRLATLIRNHWSIENAQHWTLDMAFNEDQSRVRKDHGDQNLAVMRRLALGLLRRDKQVKVGAKNKRLKAGRNTEYLLSVLLGGTMAK
jgi:predicted transposase YbfD/YdcC